MKNKKRVLDTIVKITLFFGVIHILTLSIYSIKTKNINHLNYLKFLDLDLFFPTIADNFLISIIILVIIFLVFYFFFANKSKSHE